MATDPDRIITKKELVLLVPYSIQHIGRLEKQKLFPKRVPLGPRRVGWYLSAVEQWRRERSEKVTVLSPGRGK